MTRPSVERAVTIPAGRDRIEADLVLPPGAHGIVLFAHGSGSGRFSPRNRRVAAALQQARLATLLLDLLTEAEERIDAVTGELRFDIPFLAGRLLAATDWCADDVATRALPIGYFGASTGAAAALVAAARKPERVAAVVSRGGRPDLAGDAIQAVRAPTLLIVGALDTPVLALNREAYARLSGVKRLEVVPGASHLFEEPGKLEVVAELARDWFLEHLGRAGGPIGRESEGTEPRPVAGAGPRA